MRGRCFKDGRREKGQPKEVKGGLSEAERDLCLSINHAAGTQQSEVVERAYKDVKFDTPRLVAGLALTK